MPRDRAANIEYQREYRRHHREELLAKKKEQYRRTRDAKLAYQRQHYAEHRAEKLAYQKKQDALLSRNPEIRAQRNAANRAWSKTEHGRVLNNAAQRRRYARLGKRPKPHVRDWVTILRGDPCAYCGAPTEEIDHIVPLNAGGPDQWDNLTASCRPCNRSKSDRSLFTWLSPVTRTKENA